MSPTNHRLGPRHFVVVLDEVVDLDNEATVESALRRLVRTARERTVVIDITAPIITSAGLHVLLRLRRTALAHARTLRVVAREPTTRWVFRVTRLEQTLKVSHSLEQALRESLPSSVAPHVPHPRRNGRAADERPGARHSRR
ncbi:STAS domain-containing protein [Streptomyces sp. NPDC007088]|uniref:STAS domain-containing protein n=1 Tax=Streptomyces sp. NPDC007088 TaxID=3364773 RepID=UPI0036B5CA0F